MEGHNQKITLPFLQNLVTQMEPDVTVLSFVVSHGADRGDNYTSMLYRVQVCGEQVSDGEVREWQQSLIIKRLPDSLAHRELYRSDLLFCNEVCFYKVALSALQEFQSSKLGVRNPFIAVPKCFLAEEDIVVLEDLKVRGFIMGNRKEGLDFQHCVAVFREIARFHALSLAMKSQDPAGFQDRVASRVQETFFTEVNEDYYREYYSNVKRNALEMVDHGLEDFEKPIYLTKFEDFLDENKFFKTMIRLAKPSEPMAVLAHGDCWTNNIMFRYSPEGDIEEVCFVDFQCCRYSSPAVDLYNFLYSCTSRELRAAHTQTLLTEYCSALSASLSAMGCENKSLPYCKSDDLPPLIQEEIKQHSQFGLGLALDMIPICTCDSALAPDLYETEAAGHEAVTPFGAEYSPECQRRMVDLVKDLVDLGYL